MRSLLHIKHMVCVHVRVRPLRECLGVVVIRSDTQKFLKLVHHFSWVIPQLLSINNHQLQEKIKRERQEVHDSENVL